MLGSLDCMHWEWKTCPFALHGSYTRGDQWVPTIMLEVGALQDLRTWHAFFGLFDSRNIINVFNKSPLLNDVLHECAPKVNFVVNRTQYKKEYYLTYGIYPEWATFVKSLCPSDENRKKFEQRQETARKDIERVFGVLPSRWAIQRGWPEDSIKRIWMT